MAMEFSCRRSEVRFGVAFCVGVVFWFLVFKVHSRTLSELDLLHQRGELGLERRAFAPQIALCVAQRRQLGFGGCQLPRVLLDLVLLPADAIQTLDVAAQPVSSCVRLFRSASVCRTAASFAATSLFFCAI